ncbi:MAG: DNA polymerase/3'-5' exonuclease PolX [Halobacteriales archaeon]
MARLNGELAAYFEEYADRLEAQGDEYRPRSYRRAAENIRDLDVAIEELAAEGQASLEEIDGIGESIAAKIIEYVETGAVESIEDTRAELPVDMSALTAVEGIGPKTVGDLYRELGITDLDALEAAAEAGEIRELDGYGETTERNILENIPFARQAQERTVIGDARPLGDAVVGHLQRSDAVDRCELGGSLRRWRETIGDVDVLVATDDHETAVEHFLDWDEIDETIEAGDQKASVRAQGIRVDLRVVDPPEWGSALQYFTGSKDHNVELRNRAIDRELKMNEYGVFDVSDIDDPDAGQRVGERIAGETEEGMYAAVDLPWIPPELREGRGEIDAAAAGELPTLLEPSDLRGDLHTHTDWSDGRATIEAMIEAAEAFGHDYICLTDHASGPGVVGGMGLTEADIRDQMASIDETVADLQPDIDVFRGIEANIAADGELSIDDAVLDDLDVVIASPHSALNGDGTDRLCAAMAHPAVDIIGHPSGRRINTRAGLDLDIERVVATAVDTGTALELNSNPIRLDLWDTAIKTTVEAGGTIAINTDAHSPEEYGLIRYGIKMARRGWAEPADVLNTRSADGLRDFLH